MSTEDSPAGSARQQLLASLSADGSALTLSSADEGQPPSTSSHRAIPLDTVAFINHSQSTAGQAGHLTLSYLTPPASAEALPGLHSTTFTIPPDATLLAHPAIAPLVLSRKTQAVDIILNDFAGARQAKKVVTALVDPLLAAAGVTSRVWETEREAHAGEIAQKLVAEGRSTLLVAGGDGTVHEVVNGLLLGEGGEVRKLGRDGIEVVLVPLGTGNALYHHSFPPESLPAHSPLALLHSLLAFLRGQRKPSPLPLALNTLTSQSSSLPPVTPVVTTVVSSCALHAALLHDAEQLRASHPGVERFKIAAQENVKKWWQGRLTLGAGSHRYDADSRGWANLGEGDEVLEGPVAYLVSALVSRFEPNFVVGPHRSPRSKLAPTSPSIDLVLIRPLRNSVIAAQWIEAGEDEERQQAVRDEFVARVWEVTGGMYSGGTHVDLRYGAEQGGELIVEYLRTAAFEWSPAPSNAIKDNLVCLDGALHDVGRGGSVAVRALGAEFGIALWA